MLLYGFRKSGKMRHNLRIIQSLNTNPLYSLVANYIFNFFKDVFDYNAHVR